MIQVPAQASIYLMHEPVSFHKQIDGLFGIVKQILHLEPMSGSLFIFRNRSATAIRILCYDGTGFWLCTKRLSTGRFRYWPGRSLEAPEDYKTLLARDLQVLLWGGNPWGCGFPALWRKIA